MDSPHFGPEYEPRVGWSLTHLDPRPQAVLQAYMGMDAWFFTRISSDAVRQKKSRSLEFVWRAVGAPVERIRDPRPCHVVLLHAWRVCVEWDPSLVPNASTLHNK